MPIIPAGGTRDMRAEVLPPELLPLFNDGFVRSCDLLEEYVGRLALSILRELGGDAALGQPKSLSELIDELGLEAKAARVPLGWLLRLIRDRGSLHSEEREGETYFFLDSPLPTLDPDEIRQEQEAHDAAALPSYEIAAFAAESYPTCLRGEISGERALFAPQRLAHWSRYFNNGNPLYAINNRIPAMVAAKAGSLGSILELGGGLGSGASALLEEIHSAGRLGELENYRFTDISPVFLRRGERALRATLEGLISRQPTGEEATAEEGPEVKAGRVDIDRPLTDQGLEPESHDLVFAVNTVHVARDLGETLGQIHHLLKPGGSLVLGEGIRPFPGQAIYSELVFLLLDSFSHPVIHPEYRPAGSFLTPENWRAALSSSGFDSIESLPDITRVREHYPSFLVAGLSARRG